MADIWASNEELVYEGDLEGAPEIQQQSSYKKKRKVDKTNIKESYDPLCPQDEGYGEYRSKDQIQRSTLNQKEKQKRQKMNHLSLSSSLLDYNKVISALIGNEQNIIYLYEFRGIYYYAVRGFIHEKEWLAIFGANGVMETAFPPENIDYYLERRGFVPLGRMKEVLKWTE
jgi:hypothetical protein